MKFIKASLVILSSFALSSILYLYLKGYWYDFFSSDIFWVIFMPSFLGGWIFLQDKKDLKLGLSGKILLGLLLVIWIVLIVTLFSK